MKTSSRNSLPLQDAEGIFFWPWDDVAEMKPEYGTRWQVTHRDGRLAHRPAPPEPEYQEDGDPTVRYLRGEDGEAFWHTDAGPVPAGPSAKAVAHQHPNLVRCGAGLYLNRRRLARITRGDNRFHVFLDSGEEFTPSWGSATKTLQVDLGLESLYTLDPSHDLLYAEGLRDWPFELFVAEQPELAQVSSTPRGLIANTLWQTFREGRQYGTLHRSYWYRPLVTMLERAGFNLPPSWEEPERSNLYALFQKVVGDYVGQHRLFTYRELGFEEPEPEKRQIGSSTVVVAEKPSALKALRLLHERFGVSTLCTSGIPKLVATEFFVQALQPKEPVRVVAFVDFDPGGWIIGDSFCNQLERYGVQVRDLRFLLRPELFTERELRLFSLPIPTPTPQVKGKVEAWLKRSGGIYGEARRIQTDNLVPDDRAVEAFAHLPEGPDCRLRAFKAMEPEEEPRRFLDLSVPLEADRPTDPPGHLPEIDYLTHQDTVEQLTSFFPGLGKDDLPDGEGWALERVRLTTHNGTHLDAPYHFASTMDGGQRAWTIDEVPLEWCYRPGVKLDFRHLEDGHVVTAAEVAQELQRIGYELQPLDIVLVNTRAGQRYGEADYLAAGCGMGREATLYLLDRGVRLTGTDGWSWDAPFVHTARRYAATGDASLIWEGHRAGRETGYCHLEKLHNLEWLPSYGFTVSCFPVKIKGASAGWTRAVAIL